MEGLIPALLCLQLAGKAGQKEVGKKNTKSLPFIQPEFKLHIRMVWLTTYFEAIVSPYSLMVLLCTWPISLPWSKLCLRTRDWGLANTDWLLYIRMSATVSALAVILWQCGTDGVSEMPAPKSSCLQTGKRRMTSYLVLFWTFQQEKLQMYIKSRIKWTPTLSGCFVPPHFNGITSNFFFLSLNWVGSTFRNYPNRKLPFCTLFLVYQKLGWTSCLLMVF